MVVANIYIKNMHRCMIVKSVTVCLLPKQKPLASVENDIRPISLTCHYLHVTTRGWNVNNSLNTKLYDTVYSFSRIKV